MRLSSPDIVAALSFLSLGLCDRITFTGSAAARAKLITAYKIPSLVTKRQNGLSPGAVLLDGTGSFQLEAAAGEAKNPGKGAAAGGAAGGLTGIDKARQSADKALKNADKARQRLDKAKSGKGKTGGEKAAPAGEEKANPAGAVPAGNAPVGGEKAAGENTKAE